MFKRKLSILVIFIFTAFSFHSASMAETKTSKKCLFINSYHKGLAWSDDEEAGLYSTLKNKCELTSFYMDMKNHPEPEFGKNKALEIKEKIEKMKPDVIITADDSVAEHLIVPYFKNSKIPIIFCGINWSVEKYGFPFKNVTGMIEVSPLEPMIKNLKAILPEVKKVFFLSGDAPNDVDSLIYVEKKFTEEKIQLKSKLVKTMDDWKKEFLAAQTGDYDFIYLYNNAKIKDWKDSEVEEIIKSSLKKVTISNFEYMSKFSVLVVAKIGTEQGEWAGAAANEVLNGVSIEKIPIVANRKWKTYLNVPLANQLKLKIPPNIRKQSIVVGL